MYLALDIGGSKTLAGVFSDDGSLVEVQKIPTNQNYEGFLQELEQFLGTTLKTRQFAACCCAIPGKVDRKNGVGIVFGNLPWENVPIRDNLKKMLGGIPTLIENDSNLAGLSEAIAVRNEYKKVLYMTISTGIGDGIIIDGIIDPAFADSESGQMVLMHEGQLMKWEDFASGRALVKKYGKKASEIDNPAIWREFVPGIAAGLDELIATLQPDVVIIGGGVGAHFEKFGTFLIEELKKYENKMVKIPPIIKAKRPEEAVIYGCYEFTRQSLDKNK